MRLVSYRNGDEVGVGVMVDDQGFVALPKAAPELPNTLRAILDMGDDGLAQAAAGAEGKAADYNIDDVTLDAVIPNPDAIFALALNFQAHLDETGLTTNGQYPHIFKRLPSSQVGHGQPLIRPYDAGTFSYEGEVAAIIGKTCRRIKEEDAAGYVAGYAIYNEGSVRGYQGHNRHFGLGKNFHQSGSFGPWLMTSDEFGDPNTHTIITTLNGEEYQHESLDKMMFSHANIIAYISQGYELQPGDVVVSGTPGAILGKKHKPMQAGDDCIITVTGLGALRNSVVAEPEPAG